MDGTHETEDEEEDGDEVGAGMCSGTEQRSWRPDEVGAGLLNLGQGGGGRRRGGCWHVAWAKIETGRRAKEGEVGASTSQQEGGEVGAGLLQQARGERMDVRRGAGLLRDEEEEGVEMCACTCRRSQSPGSQSASF